MVDRDLQGKQELREKRWVDQLMSILGNTFVWQTFDLDFVLDIVPPPGGLTLISCFRVRWGQRA